MDNLIVAQISAHYTSEVQMEFATPRLPCPTFINQDVLVIGKVRAPVSPYVGVFPDCYVWDRSWISKLEGRDAPFMIACGLNICLLPDYQYNTRHTMTIHKEGILTHSNKFLS